MATISQIKTDSFFSSFRFRISLTFLLIVGLSFGIAAGGLNGMVGDFLFDERVRTERAELEQLGKTAAPMFDRADTASLTALFAEHAGDVTGRLLVLDMSGKVQLDTQKMLTGTLFQSEEVEAIVRRGQSVSFGVHDETGRMMNTQGILFTLRPSGSWYSYCSARLVSKDEVIGVLLLISPVTDMMTGLFSLRRQMIVIFLLVALAALALGFVFSSVLTRPVTDMTRVIQRMGKDNSLGLRVRERGSGEIRHLAAAFNSMSEKLERLEDTRNQFVANASHELKTPLAAMKVLVESLIYQPDMDKALRTEFLQDVNKEIDRLSAIVSDLLTLVRTDSHSLQLNMEKLQVRQLVQENAHRLSSMIRKRDQTLNLDLNDPCETMADRSKLNQVIYNLMENASKYTQEGGTIDVSLENTGRMIVLTVRDNGPGIPAEALPHLFERFYRVDKARSRETGGTGLGLSIVRQLITLHAGTVRAESEEGKGSTFIVELPVKGS